MNAQSVWVGHEYAYVAYPRRGTIPNDWQRVKVLTPVRKVKQYGKSRDAAFVEVQFLDYERPNREVNVRNLHDFWDSYQDELTAIRVERERREAERQAYYAKQEAERQERIRVQQEVERVKKARLQRIADGLAVTLSIDPLAIKINTTYETFTIEARHLQFLE